MAVALTATAVIIVVVSWFAVATLPVGIHPVERRCFSTGVVPGLHRGIDV